MKIGDPLNDDTTVGATISPEQFAIVLAYIEGAKAEVSLDYNHRGFSRVFFGTRGKV